MASEELQALLAKVMKEEGVKEEDGEEKEVEMGGEPRERRDSRPPTAGDEFLPGPSRLRRRKRRIEVGSPVLLKQYTAHAPLLDRRERHPMRRPRSARVRSHPLGEVAEEEAPLTLAERFGHWDGPQVFEAPPGPFTEAGPKTRWAALAQLREEGRSREKEGVGGVGGGGGKGGKGRDSVVSRGSGSVLGGGKLPQDKELLLLNTLDESPMFQQWFVAHGRGEEVRRMRSNIALLRRWFEALDTDGGGEVGWEELTGPLLSVGLARSAEQVRAMVTETDSTGSGELNFSEFVSLLTRGAVQEEEEEDEDGTPRPETIRALTSRRAGQLAALSTRSRVSPRAAAAAARDARSQSHPTSSTTSATTAADGGKGARKRGSGGGDGDGVGVTRDDGGGDAAGKEEEEEEEEKKKREKPTLVRSPRAALQRPHALRDPTRKRVREGGRGEGEHDGELKKKSGLEMARAKAAERRAVRQAIREAKQYLLRRAQQVQARLQQNLSHHPATKPTHHRTSTSSHHAMPSSFGEGEWSVASAASAAAAAAEEIAVTAGIPITAPHQPRHPKGKRRRPPRSEGGQGRRLRASTAPVVARTLIGEGEAVVKEVKLAKKSRKARRRERRLRRKRERRAKKKWIERLARPRKVPEKKEEEEVEKEGEEVEKGKEGKGRGGKGKGKADVDGLDEEWERRMKVLEVRRGLRMSDLRHMDPRPSPRAHDGKRKQSPRGVVTTEMSNVLDDEEEEELEGGRVGLGFPRAMMRSCGQGIKVNDRTTPRVPPGRALGQAPPRLITGPEGDTHGRSTEAHRKVTLKGSTESNGNVGDEPIGQIGGAAVAALFKDIAAGKLGDPVLPMDLLLSSRRRQRLIGVVTGANQTSSTTTSTSHRHRLLPKHGSFSAADALNVSRAHRIPQGLRDVVRAERLRLGLGDDVVRDSSDEEEIDSSSDESEASSIGESDGDESGLPSWREEEGGGREREGGDESEEGGKSGSEGEEGRLTTKKSTKKRTKGKVKFRTVDRLGKTFRSRAKDKHAAAQLNALDLDPYVRAGLASPYSGFAGRAIIDQAGIPGGSPDLVDPRRVVARGGVVSPEEGAERPEMTPSAPPSSPASGQSAVPPLPLATVRRTRRGLGGTSGVSDGLGPGIVLPGGPAASLLLSPVSRRAQQEAAAKAQETYSMAKRAPVDSELHRELANLVVARDRGVPPSPLSPSFSISISARKRKTLASFRSEGSTARDSGLEQPSIASTAFSFPDDLAQPSTTSTTTFT